MDPLVPIPRDQWPALREEFTNNWPFGIAGYYILDIEMSHPSIGMACNFMVFSPYGDISNGFIAFNTKVIFFSRVAYGSHIPVTGPRVPSEKTNLPHLVND